MSETTEVDRALDDLALMLATGPLLQSDAIVVLAGEDAEARWATAMQLFVSAGAPIIVLSGGKHAPPRWIGATALYATALGAGVAPDRLIIDNASQHTREQATALVQLAVERQWTRLLLVASPYHMTRAFLTVLHALVEAGQQETIRLIAAPASQTRWGESPPGMTAPRRALWAEERAKVAEYAEHVAPAVYGIEYLSWWEGR